MYISDLKQARLDVASQCGDFKVFNPAETDLSTIFSGNNKVDVLMETTGSGLAFIVIGRNGYIVLKHLPLPVKLTI